MKQLDNTDRVRTNIYAPLQPSYKPNHRQTERAAAMRRFNRLYVYGPILLVSLLALVLVALLFWGVFSPGIRGTAAFASTLANIILIMALLPPTLLGGVLAVGLIALYGRRVRRRRQKPPADRVYIHQYGRLRVLLWRVESLIDQVNAMLNNRILPRVTRPVIRGHGIIVYAQTLFSQLKSMLHRS